MSRTEIMNGMSGSYALVTHDNPDSLSILVATWNMGAKKPPSDLEPWLPYGGGNYDIICVGTQDSDYKALAGSLRLSDCTIAAKVAGQTAVMRVFEHDEQYGSLYSISKHDLPIFESESIELSDCGAAVIKWVDSRAGENSIEYKKGRCDTLVLQVTVVGRMGDEQYMAILNSSEFSDLGSTPIEENLELLQVNTRGATHILEFQSAITLTAKLSNPAEAEQMASRRVTGRRLTSRSSSLSQLIRAEGAERELIRIFEACRSKSKKHENQVKLPVPVTVRCLSTARAFSEPGKHSDLDQQSVHVFAKGDLVQVHYITVDQQKVLWMRTAITLIGGSRARSTTVWTSFTDPAVMLERLQLFEVKTWSNDVFGTKRRYSTVFKLNGNKLGDEVISWEIPTASETAVQEGAPVWIAPIDGEVETLMCQQCRMSPIIGTLYVKLDDDDMAHNLPVHHRPTFCQRCARDEHMGGLFVACDGCSDLYHPTVRRALERPAARVANHDNAKSAICEQVLQHVGDRYRAVSSKKFMKKALIVLCKRGIEIENVQTGCFDADSTIDLFTSSPKGGVGISFSIRGTPFCFTTLHCAANDWKKLSNSRYCEMRNMQISAVQAKLFNKVVCVAPDASGATQTPIDFQHRFAFNFVLGDLNYRLQNAEEPATRESTLRKIDDGEFQNLYDADQLQMEVASGRVLNGFVDCQPAFAPTFKFNKCCRCASPADPVYVQESQGDKKPQLYCSTCAESLPEATARKGTAAADAYSKKRIPAYCDRVLYRARPGMESCISMLPGGDLQAIEGFGDADSPVSNTSDHRPVVAKFTVMCPPDVLNRANTIDAQVQSDATWEYWNTEKEKWIAHSDENCRQIEQHHDRWLRRRNQTRNRRSQHRRPEALVDGCEIPRFAIQFSHDIDMVWGIPSHTCKLLEDGTLFTLRRRDKHVVITFDNLQLHQETATSQTEFDKKFKSGGARIIFHGENLLDHIDPGQRETERRTAPDFSWSQTDENVLAKGMETKLISLGLLHYDSVKESSRTQQSIVTSWSAVTLQVEIEGTSGWITVPLKGLKWNMDGAEGIEASLMFEGQLEQNGHRLNTSISGKIMLFEREPEAQLTRLTSHSLRENCSHVLLILIIKAISTIACSVIQIFQLVPLVFPTAENENEKWMEAFVVGTGIMVIAAPLYIIGGVLCDDGTALRFGINRKYTTVISFQPIAVAAILVKLDSGEETVAFYVAIALLIIHSMLCNLSTALMIMDIAGPACKCQALGLHHGTHMLVSGVAVYLWYAIFDRGARSSASGDSSAMISCPELLSGLSDCAPLQNLIFVVLLTCWFAGCAIALLEKDTAVWRENDKKRLEIAGADLAKRATSCCADSINTTSHYRSRGIVDGQMTCTKRQAVKDEHVDWDTAIEYHPPEAKVSESGESYTDNTVLSADELMRTRHTYERWLFDEKGRPLNPRGRTGWWSRGRLPRWGPNHTVDAILTRLDNETGELEVAVIPKLRPGAENEKHLLGNCASEFSLPGVFIHDDDQNKVQAVQRAIRQKLALDGSNESSLREIFAEEPVHVFSGYVDDERNTDNAWIETSAQLYAFSKGKHPDIELQPSVMWVPVTIDMELYGNHAEICWRAKQKLDQKGKFARQMDDIRVWVTEFRRWSETRSMFSVLLTMFFKSKNLRSICCTILLVAFVRGFFDSVVMETHAPNELSNGDKICQATIINAGSGLLAILLALRSDRSKSRAPYYLAGMGIMAVGVLIVLVMSLMTAQAQPVAVDAAPVDAWTLKFSNGGTGFWTAWTALRIAAAFVYSGSNMCFLVGLALSADQAQVEWHGRVVAIAMALETFYRGYGSVMLFTGNKRDGVPILLIAYDGMLLASVLLVVAACYRQSIRRKLVSLRASSKDSNHDVGKDHASVHALAHEDQAPQWDLFLQLTGIAVAGNLVGWLREAEAYPDAGLSDAITIGACICLLFLGLAVLRFVMRYKNDENPRPLNRPGREAWRDVHEAVKMMRKFQRERQNSEAAVEAAAKTTVAMERSRRKMFAACCSGAPVEAAAESAQALPSPAAANAARAVSGAGGERV